MSESDKAKIWRSLAQRTVNKVNFGWWLDRLTPLLIVLSLIAASTVLVYRSLGRPVAENPWFYSAIGLALVVVLLAAWLMARRHFISQSAGLVRLEDRMHLKNALTTADQGIGPWPDAPENADAGLDWNWLRVATPFVIAALVVAASLLIPITSVTAAKAPPSEPLAWAQMEEWMETLEELIKEEAIEDVRAKIEELRGQPDSEWFSHSSLEATDTLRHTLNQQIQNLGADMATAERDLNALQNYASQLSEEAKEQLLAEYDQALQNMAINGMPLNSELMKALQGIDLKMLTQGQMSQLSQEQLLAEYDQAVKNMGKNGMPFNSELMKGLQGIDPKLLAQGQMSQLSQEQLDQLREALKKGSGL